MTMSTASSDGTPPPPRRRMGTGGTASYPRRRRHSAAAAEESKRSVGASGGTGRRSRRRRNGTRGTGGRRGAAPGTSAVAVAAAGAALLLASSPLAPSSSSSSSGALFLPAAFAQDDDGDQGNGTEAATGTPPTGAGTEMGTEMSTEMGTEMGTESGDTGTETSGTVGTGATPAVVGSGSSSSSCYFCPEGYVFQNPEALFGGGEDLACGDPIPFDAEDEEGCESAIVELLEDPAITKACGYCVEDPNFAGERDGTRCTLCKGGRVPTAPLSTVTEYQKTAGTCGYDANILLLTPVDQGVCAEWQEAVAESCGCLDNIFNGVTDEAAVSDGETETGNNGANGDENATEEGTKKKKKGRRKKKGGGKKKGGNKKKGGKKGKKGKKGRKGGKKKRGGKKKKGNNGDNEGVVSGSNQTESESNQTESGSNQTESGSNQTEANTADTGGTPVDVVVGLFNTEGYTAQFVMEGASAPGADISYKEQLEKALTAVFNLKYAAAAAPPSRMLQEEEEEEGQGQQLRRFLERLNLELVADPTVTAGVDVDCPPEVLSLFEASDVVCVCHEFTAALAVRGAAVDGGDVAAPSPEAIQADVEAMYDEAQSDGNLTQELESFSAEGESAFQVQADLQEQTIEPTLAAVPTPAPTTQRPTTESPTKAPSDTVDGTMPVDVVIGLYNAKNLTVQDVLDGATSEGTSFTYKNFIEAALGFAWEEKYPTSGRRLLGGGEGGDGEGGEIYRPDFAFLRDPRFLRRERDDDGGDHGDGAALLPARRLERLDLKLSSNPNVTSGVDIECPEYVPPGTVSGAVNTCQNFTARFTVQAVGLAREAVREDVTAAFDEAQRDGTLSDEINGIDAMRVFRVQAAPRGTYSGGGGGGGGGGNGTDPAPAPVQRSGGGGGGDDGGMPLWAIIVAAVGGVLVLCLVIGGVVYWRRGRGAGGPEEIKDDQRKTEAEEWNADENTGYDNF